MNAGRDVERLIADWLVEEAADGAPDRVLEATRAQLDKTRQRPRAAWRPSMNTTMTRLAALAAGVVIAVAGIALLVRPFGSIGVQPTPGVTVAPTPAPSGLPSLPVAGAIVPGTYAFGAPFGLDVEMTFATPEWTPWNNGVRTPQVAPFFKRTPDAPNLGIIIARVTNLFADACNPSDGMLDPHLGPSVDELVTALSAQPETEATAPTDVTISGYPGKHFSIAFSTTEACPVLSRWPSDAGARLAIPEERDELWVLDVDGERWVIDLFSFESTTAADIADARAIVEGLVIAPR